MSQIHSLSDDQVGQELRKMTAFIKQEATEKAREIEIKADEEFAIEKSKLVRQETDAIDQAYQKKFKQAQMSQQIMRSSLSNKTRLRILAARQELVDQIFTTAERRLTEASSDPARYASVLEGVLLEGFYAMNESPLRVRARKQDYEIVRKAIEVAAATYREETGSDMTATIDEEKDVPESSAGGVVIVGGNGKIEVDNTFEARLELLKDRAMPAMRQTLFGKNPNRRFFD